MKNLLYDDMTEAAIAGSLRACPPILPPLGADAWKTVAHNPLAQALFAPLREMALPEQQQPLPVLTDALYADFHATGSRVAFERVYFLRRRMLARAALCALLDDEEHQTGWLTSLVSKLRDVFSEVSWALPAHVASLSGKDRMTVDLFAAETANLMGEMLAVFGAALPDTLAREMRTRLRETIFQNYLDNHDAFGWTHSTNNWNAVCHQGILGAALSAGEDPALIARLLLVAKTHLPHFLEGFGADGGCTEGPGYWQYGFGWFSVLNEQLETASGGALSLFEGSAHIHEIALFYPRATFSNGYLVNFSDSAARGTANPRLLRYLGERLDDDLLRAYGNNAWRALLSDALDLNIQRGDFFYLARLFRDCPTHPPAEAALPQSDFFFQNMEVLVAHRHDPAGNLWEFAAKGGHNAEHHNHNDGGSFILHVNGQPFITEIGAPEYTKEFFSARRYEHLAARALGHSLPIVNGVEQLAGQEFAAPVLQHELTLTTALFVVDLTRCYPAAAHCLKLIRTLALDTAAGTFAVRDDYELAQVRSLETAIITHQQVQNSESGLRIVSGDSSLSLRPMVGTQAVAVTEHAYRGHHGVEAAVRRIVLKPAVLSASGSVGCTFTFTGRS